MLIRHGMSNLVTQQFCFTIFLGFDLSRKMIIIVSAFAGCILGTFYTFALCGAISIAYYKKQELTFAEFDEEKPPGLHASAMRGRHGRRLRSFLLVLQRSQEIDKREVFRDVVQYMA